MSSFLRILIIIILFSNWFEEFITMFTYFDEIISIVFFLSALVKLAMSKKNIHIFTNIEKVVFFLAILIAIFCIMSTLLSNVDNTFILQAYTLYGNFKYILIYFGARVFLMNIKDFHLENIGVFSLKLSYLASITFLIVYIIDYFLDFMTHFDNRFGMNSVTYGFGIPSEFALTILMLMCLNLYFNLKFKNKIDFSYLCLNLFLLVTAGRFTSVAFCLLIIVLIYSFRYFRKYLFTGLIVSSLISLFIAKDRIVSTFIDIEQPRGVLMLTGLQIANNNFPFGSGLGTFGSYASRLNYSELYYMYDLSGLWGLSPTFSAFITDSYWAMIIGEFGYLAALMNIMLFFSLIKITSFLKIKLIRLIVSIPLLYLVISSPVDTAIMSNSSLPLMFMSALLISIEMKQKNQETILPYRANPDNNYNSNSI